MKHLFRIDMLWHNLMKLGLCFGLIALLSKTGLAQTEQIDSIRYDKGHIFYHVYGRGEPIIVLSGGPGISYERGKELARLVAQKHGSVLLEQRGTGRSMPRVLDSTTINLNESHADINRLLTRFQLQQAVIVGHSWGGMLAMSYARAFPDKIKTLVLIAPGPFTLDDNQFQEVRDNRKVRLSQAEQDEQKAILSKSDRTANDQRRLKELEALTNIYDKHKLDSLFANVSAGEFHVRTNALMSADLYRTKYDLTPFLRTFNKPVHLICGRQDPLAFVAYRLSTLLPNVKTHWISQCGHFPMFEQPTVFLDNLYQSLGDV